ncbi:hypothetical protein QUA83_07150 [Microcoleus sp. K1-B1]
MSFYAIAHQLLAAVTGQIRRRSRKKFKLVALSLLAVGNIHDRMRRLLQLLLHRT